VLALQSRGENDIIELAHNRGSKGVARAGDFVEGQSPYGLQEKALTSQNREQQGEEEKGITRGRQRMEEKKKGVKLSTHNGGWSRTMDHHLYSTLSKGDVSVWQRRRAFEGGKGKLIGGTEIWDFTKQRGYPG